MSKFKVGDWIINTKTESPIAFKILEINAQYYKVKPGQHELGFSRLCEDELRLATKDEINKSVRIYGEIKNKRYEIDPFWTKLFLTIGIIAFLWYNFSPFFDNPIKERIGAICADGWQSSSTSSGACSHHGGVSQWVYNEIPHETGVLKKLFISLIVGWMASFPVLGFLGFLKDRYKES